MKITMETVAQRSILDQSEVCSGQKMDVLENFYQRSHATRIDASRLPGKCDPKKFRRHHTQNLFQEVTPEQRGNSLMKLRGHPGAGRNPVRHTLSDRLTPKVDHRRDGIPQSVVNDDLARRM